MPILRDNAVVRLITVVVHYTGPTVDTKSSGKIMTTCGVGLARCTCRPFAALKSTSFCLKTRAHYSGAGDASESHGLYISGPRRRRARNAHEARERPLPGGSSRSIRKSFPSVPFSPSTATGTCFVPRILGTGVRGAHVDVFLAEETAALNFGSSIATSWFSNDRIGRVIPPVKWILSCW